MLRIARVWPGDGLTVHVTLTDGTDREIDVSQYMWGPVFEPIAEDRSLFEQVFVDRVSKTIAWPGGADIDPDVLLGSATTAPASALAE
ncbi:MAG: DUF2442 domain-containing protein [Acidothermaceae bacterium]